MSKVKSGSVWAWLVLIGCIGFYSIPTGIIANTSGIFVAPVMDQFGWSQTDTTMYRTIQPIVSAICAPFAGKLLLGALNDKIGIQWTGLIATIGGALGITLAWQSGANEAVFYAGMAIFGFGYAGLTVIAPMLTRGTFGPRNYSQIYSWVSTGIFIATAISFTVYGLIYDNTGSYDGCFMVVIALYVVAAVLVPFTLKAGNKLWKK